MTAAAAMADPPRLPGQGQIGHAARIAQQFVLGLGGADETDRQRDDRGGARRTGVEMFEQRKERGRRIADHDDGAGEIGKPQIDRGSRARGLLRECRSRARRDRSGGNRA